MAERRRLRRSGRASALALSCVAVFAWAVPAAASGGPPPPTGFLAESITWLSPEHGWVLGSSPCGKSQCTKVVGTTDGGSIWRTLGSVNAPITRLGQGVFGVNEVRFSTPEVGWAFGPKLFRTRDGGRSWAHMSIPGDGKQVLALAAGPDGTFAVVSSCLSGALCSARLHLWRKATPLGKWMRTDVSLPTSATANVSVLGRTAYVVVPPSGAGGTVLDNEFYASTNAGRTFARRPLPCATAVGQELVQAVPTSSTGVALLCDSAIGFGKGAKFVYTSIDTGKVDKYGGELGLYGIQSQLAASPSGNLTVTSSSIGSFIYVNDGHKTSWTMVIGYGDGGAGWNDIAYVTASEAWVVYGPADGFSGYGKILVTHDGGRRWSLVKL